MKRIPLFKVMTSDQDEALKFYVEQLGFEVSEDKRLGDYRWLLICLPGNSEICINLEQARNEAQKAVVGKQAANLPLFSIVTDDCIADYHQMKAKGVKFEGEPNVQ